MRHLFFSLITLFSALAASAQSPSAPPPGTAPAEQNDPEAKKVLDKIRKKYEGYKTVEVGFTLTSEVPGQPKDVQKGTVSQDGSKFRLDMDPQVIISDGKSTWVYLKKNNEVQINDADPKDTESGMFSPKDLLKRYQKGDYLYAISDKTSENNQVITQIEFKPKDRNSEYSKLRISINEKTGTIQSIKGFAKDGSRYTFNITRTVPNKKFPADKFVFDKTKFPGAKVEDLRM